MVGPWKNAWRIEWDQLSPGSNTLLAIILLMFSYARGSDSDYDDWAHIIGGEGWSSKNMKQYLKKHQTLEPIGEAVVDRSTMPFVGENHGTSGPIHTSFNEWKLDIEDDVVKAADKVAGYEKKRSDPWSGDHIGFYHTLGTIIRSGHTKGQRL